MREFVKIAGAVAVGTLMAAGVMAKLAMSPKFMKMYMTKTMRTCESAAKDVMEDMFEE
jgi:hypothetical protein